MLHSATSLVLLASLLFPAQAVKEKPAKEKPAKEKASPSRWEKTIAGIEKRDQVKPPADGSVFFCGSSSIVLWKLDQSFPDRKVSNRGFGGSQIADSTHFAARLILPHKPSAIVFYAGDNDIGSGKSPERVRDDFRAFVAAVRKTLPATPIFFLSIKPSERRWKLIDRIRQANTLVETFCKEGKGLTYVDVGTPLLGADGKPRKELFRDDGLHLSPAGYERWTAIVSKQLGNLGK